MAKKRPNKRGCLPPVVRVSLFFLFIFVIGFFIFYSLDNPDFMPGIRARLSGRPESRQEPPIMAQEEQVVPEAVEQDKKEGGFMERIKALLSSEEAEQEEPELPTRLEINFYYAGLGEQKLLESEQRTIVAGSKESALLNAAKELLKGPTRSYLFPVIPGGTSLIGTGIHENIARIDLSQDFLDQSLDTRILDELIIYSIVNTVTEIPGIDGVIFYIDGKRIKVYGNIDLSIPAIRNEGLISVQS